MPRSKRPPFDVEEKAPVPWRERAVFFSVEITLNLAGKIEFEFPLSQVYIIQQGIKVEFLDLCCF